MRPPPLAHGQIRQCPAAGDQNQQDRRVPLLCFLPVLLLSSVSLFLTHLLSLRYFYSSPAMDGLFRSSHCRLEIKPSAVQGLPRNGSATPCLVLAHARPRHRSPPVEAVLRRPLLFFASPRAPTAGNRLPAAKSSASPSRAACSRAKPDSQPWSPSSSSASTPPPRHLLQALEHEHELARAPPLSAALSAVRGAGTRRYRALHRSVAGSPASMRSALPSS